MADENIETAFSLEHHFGVNRVLRILAALNIGTVLSYATTFRIAI